MRWWLWLVTLVGAPIVTSPLLGADFFVDPIHGDAANDGSAARPWASLQQVVDAGVIQSRRWDRLPYQSDVGLVDRNPEGRVKAGDTIYLRSGFYGELVIEGYYNQAFIRIEAAEGHTPEFSRIRLRSCARWHLRGLHVRPKLGSEFTRSPLIALESHGFRGPIHDVVVENCEVQTIDDSSGWSKQDWDTLSCDGIQVDGTQMTVRDCVFRNVNFGISVSATHSLVEGNLVENFAGDGMRGLGDHTTFQFNTVKNCYDVNENHDDGFQSWSRGSDRRVGTGSVTGIVLRGNRIINFEDPQQPHRGALQGIGCFDGMFVDWVIENNVIITDHYHGITLLGARNCRIVNNTILDPAPGRPGPAWIRIGKHKQGMPSEGCLVRNNLADAIRIDDGQEVLADHNLIIENPETLFQNAKAYDLHLRAGSRAVDTGSHDAAPALDADGTPRPQGNGIDVGAYEAQSDS